MTLKEAILIIQSSRPENVRVIPTGKKWQVEILEGEKWTKLLHPMDKIMAEDVMRQAHTKLIFG
jgi:hypothetical protein